jgi:transaldolase
LERVSLTGSHKFRLKLFADGADLQEMIQEYKKGIVQGFTTNPTLMKKAGVKNYEEFAKSALKAIPDLPISFEVFSDDFAEMEREARKVAKWGNNVYIKIPITNTKKESSIPLIRKLSHDGLKINVTAILTYDQVKGTFDALSPTIPAIISVFAGRIADTGVDPVPTMRQSSQLLRSKPNIELLWASSRELLNLFQAEQCGCQIITITPDILKKLPLVGKDLSDLSLDTVKMFYDDAHSSGYKIL